MLKKFLVSFVVINILWTAYVLAANYVGNANTKKFHYPNCSSVREMNPNNRVEINSREEAIAQGYVPCKRCKP
ncbi:MAG: nuclease [Selenomonadaceae bacterium]|nr:nuclease [Selenomonadaceae bacterium]